MSTKFRMQTALRTDERVRLMDEIVTGVQAIKMYAWEVPYSKLIAWARKVELNVVRKNNYVRGLYMTFMVFTSRMAVFSTILAIALLYGSDQITVAKVFVISSYFGVISIAMCQIFVRGITESTEAWVSFRRIQNLLELDEKAVETVDGVKNGATHASEVRLFYVLSISKKYIDINLINLL